MGGPFRCKYSAIRSPYAPSSIMGRTPQHDVFLNKVYLFTRPLSTDPASQTRPRVSLAKGLSTALFRFSWKWRKRSPIKIMERTHEEATEALHAGRESRPPEAASAGAGADLGAV